MRQLNEVREGDIKARAGIVIYDSDSILGCLPTPSKKHPNPQRFLDLPKGHLQYGENPIDAAIRECYEETNILFERWKLIEGRRFVLYGEPFFCYLTCVDQVPDPSTLSCASTFLDEDDGIRKPEQCSYLLVPKSNYKNRFFPELEPILNSYTF